jgi:hypothetical protein
MNRIYHIESLTNEKCLKLIYNNNAEYDIKFKINDYRKLQDPKEIENKIKILNTIGTVDASDWATILELVKVVGWNRIFNNDASILTEKEIKDKLKLYYHTAADDFIVYYKDIEIYKPKTYIKTEETEYIEIYRDSLYRAPYLEAKTKILEIINNSFDKINNIKFEEISLLDILQKLQRSFNKFITINLGELDATLNSSFFLLDDNSIIPNKEFFILNVEKLIEKINQIPDEYGILINAEYNNEETIRKIAAHYKKIRRPSIKFFFQNVIEKSLFEAMVLTYIKFKDIGFISGYFSDYPKHYEKEIVNAYKIYKKYEFEIIINNLTNNKFEDVEVDDVGNVININPVQERLNLKNLINKEGQNVYLNQ